MSQNVARRLCAAIRIGILLAFAGCGAGRGHVVPAPAPLPAAPLVAVFPVENLSGATAPIAEIRQLFIDDLQRYGFGVLGDDVLERVVTEHRVRYTAGVEQAFATALKEETGADAILIPSLELYDGGTTPRVALFARLVSTGDAPAVLWIDGAGKAGDDTPGVLGIGLVNDPSVLAVNAVRGMVGSLARRIAEGSIAAGRSTLPRKFRPKIVYRSDALDPERDYTVAVVPFFNRSARTYAGEIIALHMIRSLLTIPSLRVVEPGIVREELLRFRVIMTDGVSLAQTDTILEAVRADLVLNGEVLDYEDPRATGVAPSVDFSVMFIERKTRRVVYSSYSRNAGDDGVFFFDWGRVNTAHVMASHMADAIARRIVIAPSDRVAPRSERGATMQR